MLLCQLLVVLLAAVKRCDAVVLHAWTAAKEMAQSICGFGSDGESSLAD
jgi:hypothetical protein